MKRTYLVLIITFLVIGFATVATNLIINGKINIGFNQEDFNSNVIFTNVKAINGEASITSDDKKTITFTSNKLENLEQQAKLRYDIANKSNQYDASVTISCDFAENYEKYDEWLKIEDDLKETFILQAGKTQTGNLTVTLKKVYNESLEDNVNIKCTINADPIGRDEKQEYTPVEHEYKEIILHGADPVLEGATVEAMSTDATTPKKLVPVIISDEGEVKKADIEEKWYEYEHQWWANAVILNDGVTEPEAGVVIPETDIESYFVWIPKYKYRLWNVGTNDLKQNEPFEIEIEFGTEDTTDDDANSCATPISDDGTQALSGNSKNCNNGEWMTHPAFITMGVKGFWAGKFEVGYRDASTAVEAEIDVEDPKKIIVKPNAYSWRSFANKNMIYSLKKYATNLDSHMMKNTEWGAVAILSHSEYGINYEVTQNTNSEYKTGYAKTTNGVAEYNSKDGFKASTTGNITGVYDMSGGAWERMAAYSDLVDTIAPVGKSGLTKQDILKIGKKYFDVYDSTSTNTSYEKRILGDATGEIGPFSSYRGNWYQDYSYFVLSEYPWSIRGGYYNDESGIAGQFTFSGHSGDGYVTHGSRLVLSPK